MASAAAALGRAYPTPPAAFPTSIADELDGGVAVPAAREVKVAPWPPAPPPAWRRRRCQRPDRRDAVKLIAPPPQPPGSRHRVGGTPSGPRHPISRPPRQADGLPACPSGCAVARSRRPPPVASTSRVGRQPPPSSEVAGRADGPRHADQWTTRRQRRPQRNRRGSAGPPQPRRRR